MSQHHKSGQRRRRGNNRDRRADSRQNDRPYFVDRPKPAVAKPSFFQRLLGFFGLGSKGKPASSGRNGVRPATPRPARAGADAASRPPREREERQARPPRQPVLHEVTSGRLYVGNLSYDCTESDLFELFNGVGKVRYAEVVTHKHNQRSKGFAFVEMFNFEDAKRAVAELHDKEFMGRKLLVCGARNERPDDAVTRGDDRVDETDESAAPASQPNA